MFFSLVSFFSFPYLAFYEEPYALESLTFANFQFYYLFYPYLCDESNILGGFLQISSSKYRHVSNHLDKLGFKEYRTRDMKASLLKIDSTIFENIINPICPTLSTYSPYSTYSPLDNIKPLKSNVEGMVNYVEEEKIPMVNMVKYGENGESIERGGSNLEPRQEQNNDFSKKTIKKRKRYFFSNEELEKAAPEFRDFLGEQE